MDALQIAQQSAAQIHQLADDAADGNTLTVRRQATASMNENSTVMRSFALLSIAESLRDLVDLTKAARASDAAQKARG